MTMTRRDVAKMDYDVLVKGYEWDYELIANWTWTDGMRRFCEVYETARVDIASMFNCDDHDYEQWDAYRVRFSNYMDELRKLTSDQWF